MALNSRRAQSWSPRPVATGRITATATAAVVVAVALLAACGLNVQTNRPYTPGDGVNLDAGSVHVRNLMILSRQKGSGFLSATLVSDQRDALVGVSGNVIKADGSTGSALQANVPNPVAVGNGVTVILTERPFITITSPDLEAGLDAIVVLKFSTAGEVTVKAPIVDATEPYYATVTPSASATPAG